jgi:hypothetical protein
MTFIQKIAGATKLSEITIDADKVWEDAGVPMGIDNIKEIVLGMAIGDIAVRGATGMVIVSPGIIGSQLKTKGPGNNPIYSFPDILP